MISFHKNTYWICDTRDTTKEQNINTNIGPQTIQYFIPMQLVTSKVRSHFGQGSIFLVFPAMKYLVSVTATFRSHYSSFSFNLVDLLHLIHLIHVTGYLEKQNINMNIRPTNYPIPESDTVVTWKVHVVTWSFRTGQWTWWVRYISYLDDVDKTWWLQASGLLGSLSSDGFIKRALRNIMKDLKYFLRLLIADGKYGMTHI